MSTPPCTIKLLHAFNSAGEETVRKLREGRRMFESHEILVHGKPETAIGFLKLFKNDPTMRISIKESALETREKVENVENRVRSVRDAVLKETSKVLATSQEKNKEQLPEQGRRQRASGRARAVNVRLLRQ